MAGGQFGRILMRLCFLFLIRRAKSIWRVLVRIYFTWKVKIQCGSYAGRVTVNANSTVSGTTHLDDNVHFNGMEIGGCGTVRIGRNFHSGKDCLMIAQDHKYDDGDQIPYDSERYNCRNITIDDNVWLGSRVIVLGGATIREGAIIQAGSVVVGEIPRCSVAGGHPARVFKIRDIAHYERLKQQHKFN